MSAPSTTAHPSAGDASRSAGVKGKTVAIVQSNYIPWKGYFDLINRVDEFILFDDVQFTRRDWRNRNRIKTRDGLAWLTIPVRVKGRFLQTIKDTVISDPQWNRRHWNTLVHHYARARHFREYEAALQQLYLDSTETHLSDVNFRFITAICGMLGIRTRISRSMDYHLIDGQTARLVDLCKQANATDYLSGPAAKAYVNEDLFRQAGIALHWMDYSGYPQYRQRFPPFEHRVTILDLLLSEGQDAPKYMRSFSHN